MYENFSEAFPGVLGNKGTYSYPFKDQGNIGKYFKGTGNMEILKITSREQGNMADYF